MLYGVPVSFLLTPVFSVPWLNNFWQWWEGLIVNPAAVAADRPAFARADILAAGIGIALQAIGPQLGEQAGRDILRAAREMTARIDRLKAVNSPPAEPPVRPSPADLRRDMLRRMLLMPRGGRQT